ncbi:hypothetical protein HAX54_050105, partial [Datura stramonium]|nr:hypothetical protein [Datura stramonium]
MTIDDSPVGSGETRIECWFGLILASSDNLDPALNQRFIDRDRSRLSADTLLEPAGAASALN